MKLPNGYGSVTKLSGKRRKPYIARVTAKCEFNPETQEYDQRRLVLGYYEKKADALEALAAYSRNPYCILESTMSVKEIWDSIKDDVDASEDRKKVYNGVFARYMQGIAGMRIKDVKTKHLQKTLDDCPHGYSTKSNIRCVMNHIFNYAAQNDLVDKNYTDFIKFEQEATMLKREIYTDEEIAFLWTKAHIEEYAFTLVLLHQGMRIKELMDQPEIDLEAKTINIKQAKNEYSVRVIPINMAVYDLVKRFAEHPTTLNKQRYEYFTKTILGHRAYDSRHTFATKCNDLEIKPIIIQRLMGHKPDSILEQVYIHLSIEDLSEAINKVNYGVQ